MNTCQNPKCGAKYKSDKKFCSSSCYKKSGQVRKEKFLWRNYWEIKLHHAPFGKITREEYQTMDYINTHQRFTNLRA